MTKVLNKTATLCDYCKNKGKHSVMRTPFRVVIDTAYNYDSHPGKYNLYCTGWVQDEKRIKRGLRDQNW